MNSTITIVYPDAPGARLDIDHYRDRHLPLIREAWGRHGLLEAQAYAGTAALDGSAPPYRVIALLTFGSQEAAAAALGSPEAAQVLGDVVNFSTIAPVAQFSSQI